MESIRLDIQGALDFTFRNKTVLALFALALFTRLPLMSISLDEVDAANFRNALTYGYNVPWLRPHPPGYPVYMFMGWIVEGIIGDPLLSLTLISAILGCLTIIPFYFLIRDIAEYKVSAVGSLLFIFNPLVWSLSEAALSDAPSMFFGVLLAWLCYRSRHSDKAFLIACVVASLAIGVRQPNIALLPLLAFPLVYQYLTAKVKRWKLIILGAQLFVITSLAWFVPAVFISSGGLTVYLEAINKQWSTAVRVYDITHVGSPWILNVPYRVERFFLGYFFIYPWAGTDVKTPFTILLLFPWLFGFRLFVASFNFRDPKYLFIGLWLAGIIDSILAIHFLPRYVLPQFPAFVIACLLGYRFLGAELLAHPRRVEIVAIIGIGCMLVSFAIKHQPPVAAFEFSPPVISAVTGIFSTLGLMLFVVSWVMYNRLFGQSKDPTPHCGFQKRGVTR
jgi:4-amino-4-deoxy-L-arabinose transferase-like glycosyltransferase